MHGASAERPPPDKVLADIADYVVHGTIQNTEAYDTARMCLMDAIGCGILALNHDDCVKLLGPVVPDTIVPIGATVPGTDYLLDPIKAAFDIGCTIRWLDYNDTWLAAEWGHPSDNLGGILAVADYLSRKNLSEQKPSLKVRDVLTALIKAYEIQGVLALDNCFNRAGIDHVILVRVATAAVAAGLLGGSRDQILNAVSNAWADGGNLRLYRHAPNAGSRKSWAAGDATSRGVWLAMLALKGEMGYPSVLTQKTWGLSDALLRSKPIALSRPLGSYVVENILFKIDFPAEFHAQTAVECALQLHPEVKERIADIEKITIWTQEPATRIIDKKGPLSSYADRDHCLRYMVAVPLLVGRLSADDYTDEAAKDARIDQLRAKTEIHEEAPFSADYLHPEKRSIANALQIRFKDGTSTERICIEYPVGHRRRRSEGLPKLRAKFRSNLSTLFSAREVEHLAALFSDPAGLDQMPVDEFMDMLCPKT